MNLPSTGCVRVASGGWHALRYSEGRAWSIDNPSHSCTGRDRSISWPVCESLIPRPARVTWRNAAYVTTNPGSRAFDVFLLSSLCIPRAWPDAAGEAGNGRKSVNRVGMGI